MDIGNILTHQAPEPAVFYYDEEYNTINRGTKKLETLENQYYPFVDKSCISL